LKECGIFGVSSDEYLQFAQQNRQEWELKGQDIVAEMLKKASSKRNYEEKKVALATKKHEGERVEM
jgi:predicted TPR repeat methyltransferase